MTDTPRSTLAHQVEKLARPHTIGIRQRGDGGKGWRVTEVVQEPLITMLRTLGTPTAGSAGSSPAARALIDADALEKTRELRDHIEQLWGTVLPPPAVRMAMHPAVTLESSLDAWHTLFAAHLRARTAHPPHLGFAVDLTAYWVKTITDRFDPPRTGDIAEHCPRCGQRYAASGLGDRVPALRTTFGAGVTLTVDCRSCTAQWVAEQGIRELHTEILIRNQTGAYNM